MAFVDQRVAYRAQLLRLANSISSLPHAVSPIELVELDRKLSPSSIGISYLHSSLIIAWNFSVWCGCVFRNAHVHAF